MQGWIDIPNNLLDSIRQFIFSEFLTRIYSDIIKKANNWDIESIFWYYVTQMKVQISSESHSLSKEIDPDTYISPIYKEKYNIENLKPITVKLSYKEPAKSIHSQFDHKNNTLIIYLKKRYLKIKHNSSNSKNFSIALETVLDDIMRDTNHELTHWVQEKVLSPLGYDMNANIDIDPGQSIDKAYENQYFKSEREFQPLLINALYDLYDVIEENKDELTEEDFNKFTLTNKTFKKIKEQDPKQWQRAKHKFKDLVQQLDLI